MNKASNFFVWSIFLVLSALSFNAYSADLTGVWRDEDNKKYHITQVGSQVYWLGDARPGSMDVFSGNLTNDTIRGSWARLPGYTPKQSGFVTLKIETVNRIAVVSQAGSFFSGSILVPNIASTTASPKLPAAGTNLGGASVSSAVSPSVTTPGSTQTSQDSGTIEGMWRWSTGAIVTIMANGRLKSGSLTGNWVLEDAAARRYSFRWSNNYTDTMRLMSKTFLKGTNNNGSPISADRLSAPPSSGDGVSGATVSSTTGTGTGTSLSSRETVRQDAAQPGAKEIQGSWSWFNGRTVIVSPDGNLTAGPITGKWVYLGGRQYSLRWSNGAVDTMTVSPDGQKLDGSNQSGMKVWATRGGAGKNLPEFSGGEEIAGLWSWFNGRQVTITEDGQLDAGGIKGEWKLADPKLRKYRLTWSNGAVDNMTLSATGQRLDAKDYGKSNVWGIRIGATPGGGPWETAQGQACFEDYIREVERRLNTYDGGPNHNDRKPWYINQWGVLNSRTSYGPTSDRAPDEFGKYQNRYHYMWYYWHRKGPNWGKADLDNAGIPDIWEYVEDCLRRM